MLVFKVSMTLSGKASIDIVGNGENACNKHFLLFPQCFLPYSREKKSFEVYLSCKSFQFSNVKNIILLQRVTPLAFPYVAEMVKFLLDRVENIVEK